MDIDAEALVAFTQQLVRIPSVHDPATGRSEEPVARLVAATCASGAGRRWSRRSRRAGRTSICTIDGGLPGPTLLFEGHSDVVTEGDLSGWTVDPFGATIVDGRLYGRGRGGHEGRGRGDAVRGPSARRGAPFPGRLRVAVLVDEEGMMLGAKDFVARGHADDVDAAICCEPEAGEVCHVAKGALRIHVPSPERWPTARCRTRDGTPCRRWPPSSAAWRRSRTSSGRPSHRAYLGDVYLTPTVLRAGEPVQMNVIPAGAEVWVDVRTIPGVSHDEVVARLDELAAKAAAAHDVEHAPRRHRRPAHGAHTERTLRSHDRCWTPTRT